VVPHEAFAGRSAVAPARRRRDGALPRRYRAQIARTLIDSTHRRAAWGGIIGPVVFITTWLTTGIVASHYSPVDDPISRLAAVHASTRVAMTLAFVVFGVAMMFYASALRAALPGPAWIAAGLAGAATIGVAAFPLDHSATVDHLHGVGAGLGYGALAATALLAAAPLAQEARTALAIAAVVLGTITGFALLLTLLGPAEGLWQRIGLTAGDAWVIASAVAMLRGSA
jgi:hypothetical membrane protein